MKRSDAKNNCSVLISWYSLICEYALIVGQTLKNMVHALRVNIGCLHQPRAAAEFDGYASHSAVQGGRRIVYYLHCLSMATDVPLRIEGVLLIFSHFVSRVLTVCKRSALILTSLSNSSYGQISRVTWYAILASIMLVHVNFFTDSNTIQRSAHPELYKSPRQVCLLFGIRPWY